MTIQESIERRALNDYTADKVTQPKKWEQPRKVAMSISSYAPGMTLDLKNKQQSRECKD